MHQEPNYIFYEVLNNINTKYGNNSSNGSRGFAESKQKTPSNHPQLLSEICHQIRWACVRPQAASSR